MENLNEALGTDASGGQKGLKIETFALIPPKPLMLLAELYGRGAQKYSDRNWERGYPYSWSFSAAQRHMWQFWGGQDRDFEMKVPHPICAAFHMFAITDFMFRDVGEDDRP